MVRFALMLVMFSTTLAHSTPATAEPGDATALPRAHAHNDYYHSRPLLDALGHGFCSVEADIYLHDGKLLVGHDVKELRAERSLQALYLDPLRQRVAERQGWVFEKGQSFTLLVDIKSEGEATYEALRKVLGDYREMLSSVQDGKYHGRAIDIVLSGNRPRATVAAQAERYVFLDGRFNELDDQPPSHLVPLVSENWNNHFSWRGEGTMPADQKTKLRSFVAKMHTQQRRLRFWATPERPAFWAELTDAGVDLLGTDDLAAMQRFLSAPANHDSPQSK